jgi:hypothetical protein
MEVGAPASGIEFASGAKALTPRHDDLEAGIWARDPSLQRRMQYTLSVPRVEVAGRSMVFDTRK